ncbi:hypothetical protein EDD91_0281 [Streptomyces sp. KS 21]|nr:hypothetical protein EDD91_0281 [Streptomyces sp. KS 21]
MTDVPSRGVGAGRAVGPSGPPLGRRASQGRGAPAYWASYSAAKRGARPRRPARLHFDDRALRSHRLPRDRFQEGGPPAHPPPVARSHHEGRHRPSAAPPRSPKGCPVIPGGRTTTATAPRCVVGTSAYAQYADAPPPCDAPHLTPCADPPGITGQPLAGKIFCQAMWAKDARQLADFYAAAPGTKVSLTYRGEAGEDVAFDDARGRAAAAAGARRRQARPQPSIAAASSAALRGSRAGGDSGHLCPAHGAVPHGTTPPSPTVGRPASRYAPALVRPGTEQRSRRGGDCFRGRDPTPRGRRLAIPRSRDR